MSEKIITEVDVPFENVIDLIVSAIEAGTTYGCGYWCYADFEKSSPPQNADKKRMQDYLKRHKEDELWYAHWVLFDGHVTFVEHNDESEEPPVDHKLTRIIVRKCLALMAKDYPEKFARVLSKTGTIDGPLGEEFLQLCFFGELKYG